MASICSLYSLNDRIPIAAPIPSSSRGTQILVSVFLLEVKKSVQIMNCVVAQ